MSKKLLRKELLAVWQDVEAGRVDPEKLPASHRRQLLEYKSRRGIKLSQNLERVKGITRQKTEAGRLAREAAKCRKP